MKRRLAVYLVSIAAATPPLLFYPCMAYLCRVFPEHRLGIGVFHGTVEGSDAVGAFRDLYTDPAFRPDFDVLWDGTGITSLVLAPDELNAVAEAIQQYDSPGRTGRVAIAAGHPQNFENAFFLKVKVQRKNPARRIQLFSTTDAACAWLDVPASVSAL